jgi:hypothetical protein
MYPESLFLFFDQEIRMFDSAMEISIMGNFS